MKPRMENYAERSEGLMVTRRHAEHIATLADLDADEIAGKSFAELGELVAPHLIPTVFWLRRICGRVVKRDPVTGELRGVPYATVYVEDTDSSLLWYFPKGWEWGWYLPLWGKREVIATAVTDECGYWCAWVPRWDIDRVLRFRRERRCFLDLGPLRVRDVLERYVPLPGPGPDPEPDKLREAHGTLANILGDKVARAVAQPREAAFGERAADDSVLEQRAFPRRLPPPVFDDAVAERIKHLEPAFAKAAAKRDVQLRPIEPWRWHGPFVKCVDVLVPEITTVFDVPDITFRVAQDVDGDGDQDTIYDEGPFDVRWNDTTVDDVVLEARQNAVASVTCDDQPEIECGTVPAIEAVGLMPARAPYLDGGYGKRPNRRSATGLGVPPYVPGDSAFSPFAGTLQLYACADVAGAEYYRVLYRFNGGSEREMVVPDWHVTRKGGLPGPPTVTMHCDADGWFPVDELQKCVVDHMVLYWHTPAWDNGAYELRLELADGAKNPLAGAARYSAPVLLRVDNSPPTCLYTVKARIEGDPTPWSSIPPLPAVCPVVERPPGKKVELRVDWVASAAHLRNVTCSAYGCGAGGVSEASSSAGDYRHWYETASDNTVSRVSTFEIDSSAPNGAYHVAFDVVTRAFNPSGDNNAAAADWFYDPRYVYITPEMVIAVYTV